MKEKLAIFVDTEITSGGAYQELLYMIDRIVEFNHDNLEIVIISIFPNSKLKFIDKRYKVYKAKWNDRLRRNFYHQVKGHGFNGTKVKATMMLDEYHPNSSS
jgi:hypothetical protein